MGKDRSAFILTVLGYCISSVAAAALATSHDKIARERAVENCDGTGVVENRST